jgi:AcrR family transcriptional regulator
VVSPARPGAAPAVTGRRERRKLATREAVREAALRLAVRHGVQNITVEQIAAEADIALRTFFNHFSSKEEAIVAFAAAGAEALITQFQAQPHTESVLRALREAALVVMDQSDVANHEHIQALRLIRTEPSLLPHQLAVITTQETRLANAIAERMDPDKTTGKRSARSAAYPRLCAAAALAALRVAVDLWLAQSTAPGTVPATDILRHTIDQALNELATGLDWPS